MLQLMKLPGMGPKTVAFLWDAIQVASMEDLEAAIAADRLNDLPRFGKKRLRSYARVSRNTKRPAGSPIDDAEEAAEKLVAYLRNSRLNVIEPAGSLRRGRETVGDLDILVTGPACAEDKVDAAVEYTAAYPPAADLLAKAQKVSFKLRSGLQVDVRLLPVDSYGAALQYFAGSKMHNVTLRQRALKRGYTLSKSLSRIEDGRW